MPRKRYTISTSGGHIYIRGRGSDAPPPVDVPGIDPPAPESGSPKPGVVRFTPGLLKLAETRVEGGFTFGTPEQEVIYAVISDASGSPRLLTLADSRVVVHADPGSIRQDVGELIEYIKAELTSPLQRIVHMHTHPYSDQETLVPDHSSPSSEDADFFSRVGSQFEASFNCEVVFGVHAVSQEIRGPRTAPEQTHPNRIKWSSINRRHWLGLWTAKGPVEVEIGN